jgi:hypothetical protein
MSDWGYGLIIAAALLLALRTKIHPILILLGGRGRRRGNRRPDESWHTMNAFIITPALAVIGLKMIAVVRPRKSPPYAQG